MGFVGQFLHTAGGMAEIVCIAAAGWLFARARLLTAETISTCSSLIIGLFLPALILNNLVSEYNVFNLSWWWIYPLLGMLVSGIGALISWIGCRHLGGRDFRDCTVLLAFQN